MREIERYVILQIVDTRWREHLESMDYLREGVHLRAMAQKDPLVEYRGEGHAMFEELGRVIREEVVLTLFHVEVQRDEAEQQLQPIAARRRRSPYEHEQLHGRRRDRRRRRRRRDGARRAARDDADGDAEAGRQRAPGHRAQRPVLVRLAARSTSAATARSRPAGGSAGRYTGGGAASEPVRPAPRSAPLGRRPDV